MPPSALMIFAAGFGTRMGDLTRDRPKPLVEVAGTPLIDHALGYAKAADLSPVVVNAHYRADQLAAHVPDWVSVSHETPEILDTGGGLRQALPLLGSDPVFTFNADALFSGPNPFAPLREAWDPDRMDGLLLLCPPERALGHTLSSGFQMEGDGRLSRAPELAYTGVQILRTEALHNIPDTAFSLNRLWDLIGAEGRLFGTVYPGQWCDVGHPGGIPLAEAMLRGTDV